MSQPARGMPFGSIYGAMLFVIVAVRAGDLLDPTGASPMAVRYSLSLLASALVLGLIGRRCWARWSGVAFAGLVVVLGLRLPDPGAVGLIFVLGASVAALLLLVPATGDPRPPDPGARRGSPILAGVAGLAAAGLLVGLALPGRGAVGRSGAAMPAVRFPDRVAWSDFGRGSERARAEDRPMVVSFETAWCGFCKKLNRTTWTDAEVISRLADLVAVRVDAEETTPRSGFRGRDLAARFDVEGYPTLLVLDSAGRLLSRVSGYLGPQQFLEWLERSLGDRAPRSGGNMQVSGRQAGD